MQNVEKIRYICICVSDLYLHVLLNIFHSLSVIILFGLGFLRRDGESVAIVV